MFKENKKENGKPQISEKDLKQYQVEGTRTDKAPSVDAKAIERALKEIIKGEVRFDDGDRALYATDSSNYKMYPIGLVIPKDEEDVIKTVEICRHYGAPILTRGGGTSLAGQTCNTAVIMDISKYYNKLLRIDTERKLATVQPGIIYDMLNRETFKYGLVFAPDPSTHNHCTIGGMIGNNSCGVHSILSRLNGLGSRTSDNLYEMEILTYDGLKMKVGKTSEEELNKIISEGGRKGEIYKRLRDLRDKYGDEIREKFPKIPRRVSGFNLDELLPENGFNVARALSGTEGTCVTYLNATLHLLSEPKEKALLLLGYPDVVDAAHNVPEIIKYKPISLEGIDDQLIDFMVNRHMHIEEIKLLPPGKGWLIMEMGGDSKEDAMNKARYVMEDLKKKGNPPSMSLFDDPEEEEKIWIVRESGLGATAFVPGKPDSWEGWEDAAVPPDKLGDYIADFKKLMNKFGYFSAIYGHFGDGIVHCRLNFDLITTEGLKKYRAFLEEASSLVARYGGVPSGEHGDGQSKAELIHKIYGERLMEAFREFKSIWDPKSLMNPGKTIKAYPILSNLRLGKDYHPWHPETHFKYPTDGGSFARATLRCVGVGKCRRVDGGTMCPSFMVTQEEKHTTRGRAHALFEMLQGEKIKDQWQDEYVKETLDLCLSCKGCKGDCPVKVDIATYKAEFLSHYYKNKIRPLHAYVFGRIATWSRIGTKFPTLTNKMLHSSFPGKLIKKLIGVSEHREIPGYAEENFKSWFFKRKKKSAGKEKVLLWADTFNNYFHPEVAKAAVEVLEHYGYKVEVPRAHLCCGRPLYDYGMLDTAKKWLREIMDTLKDDIHNEVSIVALEPSCASVFRDELINLFPADEDAKRLSKNVFLLSEFMEKKVKNYNVPQLHRKAVVHGHCHHKAIMQLGDETSVLKKAGLNFHVLDSGCCGMAGAFGYEKDNYEVSVKAGERVLIPATKTAEEDTLLIMNGFSCKEQVRQLTGKKGLHLAEILRMAIKQTEG